MTMAFALNEWWRQPTPIATIGKLFIPFTFFIEFLSNIAWIFSQVEKTEMDNIWIRNKSIELEHGIDNKTITRSLNKSDDFEKLFLQIFSLLAPLIFLSSSHAVYFIFNLLSVESYSCNLKKQEKSPTNWNIDVQKVISAGIWHSLTTISPSLSLSLFLIKDQLTRTN